MNVPVTSDRPRRPSGAPWVAPCRGLKPPSRRTTTCGPPPVARLPGACLGAFPLSTSLSLPPPRRTPRSRGAYPRSRGGTPGHSPSCVPTTGSTGHPDVFPASPRPVQGRLSRQSLRGGVPPSPLGTRALHGGRGRLRFRGAYPPVPPECPPHSARQGALRAPTTKNSAPHEGRGELPPITVPAPSRRKTRSVTIIQALAVRQLPKLSLQYVPHLRPRSREQRIRRRTL